MLSPSIQVKGSELAVINFVIKQDKKFKKEMV